MTEKDFYYTVETHNEIEIKIQKSRFIADVFPVKSKEDFSSYLDLIKKKYFDARHHPYAYKIGLKDDIYKTSDDGEPARTSGKPILDAINKFELTDIALIVTRYFGGVKLGVGGLKRAYFDAAEKCISSGNIVKKFITRDFTVEIPYEYIGGLMNLIEKSGISILENISEINAKLKIRLHLSQIEEFSKAFTNITNGKGKII